MNPHTDNRNHPSCVQDAKAALGWGVVFANSAATSMEVFLHRNFGERYFGMQSALVLLLVPFYSLFWRGYDLRPLLQFLAAYLVMCFVAQIGILARRRRGGPQVHSQYSGTPHIMRLLPWLSERTVKVIVEPMLLFVIAVMTMSVSEPLGGYLMLCSVALCLTVNLAIGMERKRAIDTNDAYWEQRSTAERFREMRGDY